jgi:phosphohistidine phosphatase
MKTSASKTVLILRHGRALPIPPGGDDHDRALHPKGASDVVRVAEHLRARALRPDHILTSTARRASETATGVQRVLEVPTHALEEDRRIYLADAWELLAIMQEVDDAVTTLLVVGHNPTLSHIGSLLCGRDVHLETSGLLALTHPTPSWSRLALDGRGIPL